MSYKHLAGTRRYKCADCGSTQFEGSQAMSRRNSPRCKGCGSSFLEPDTAGANDSETKAAAARVALKRPDYVPPTGDEIRTFRAAIGGGR